MILKSLMEDKQLDLDQPFISVRRLPSSESQETCNSVPKKASLPLYKSDLKSGPLRNPGKVPFLWEQTPGRPKDESKNLQHPQLAPKLPPGRIKQQSSDKDYDGPAITRLRIGDVLSISQNAASFNQLMLNHEDEGSSDSEDYIDARDTLSRTESSSLLNCSLSGLSGLDSPNVKPFGSFSDPQARDFMMDRFLPAAKAMASGSPHYSTTRKHPVARDQPRQVHNKRESLYQHRPRNVQHYIERREAEDSDDEGEYPSGRGAGCGFFPQLCLLNPMPGLRMKKGCVASLASCGSKSERKVDKKVEGSSMYEARKKLREILANKSCEWEVGEVVEKTLYIDSVHVVKSRDSKGNEFKEETHEDVNKLDVGLVRRDQGLIQSSTTAEDVIIDSTNDEMVTESKGCEVSSGLPLPPPLPKCPSESWLSRALPVVSLRNQSPLGRTRARKAQSLDPKWETIVKTSNVHHGHLRFSEELLTPIPET